MFSQQNPCKPFVDPQACREVVWQTTVGVDFINTMKMDSPMQSVIFTPPKITTGVRNSVQPQAMKRIETMQLSKCMHEILYLVKASF